MSFVYPGLLFFLVLGAIPIIIYYLMRFRSLRVDWGADYILERALARRRRKLYLDQIILLALRALAVMALVAAFARPLSRKAGTDGAGGEVLRVLLVDGSYSMLAREGSGTRRDVAMDAMRQLVSRWERGAKWSLYSLDGNPDWLVDHAEVTVAANCLQTIDALEVEETDVSLAAGLETVLAHGVGERREIYIFADDQASTWAGVEQITAQLDSSARVFWVRPPLSDHRNLAVTQLEAGHERALRGFEFPVYATIRNFSSEAVRDAELAFFVDNVRIGAKRISLPPGQNTAVSMDVRLNEIGEHLVTARLKDDALPFDNELSVGVKAAESVSILVLRDADRTGAFTSSAKWLAVAARVFADGVGKKAAPPLQITEHSEPACELATLAAHDVVVLDGGRTLTGPMAETLRRYVDQGGGLVLAADQNVNHEVWRRELGGRQLLPAAPRRVVTRPIGSKECRQLSRSGFDLPALRDLDTGVDGDITRVQFYSWTEFEAPDPEAEVLARFSDGSPYAWQRRFEHGSVILLAAGLNSWNNNLLVRETVYPFLLHLFTESASAGEYPRSVGINEPVVYMAEGDAAPVAAQFGLRNEEPVLATLTPHARGVRVEYAPGSARSGAGSLLVLRDSGRERVWVGIQGERRDSDLTPMTDDDHKALQERFQWTEVASAEELMGVLDEEGRGSERYGWVMLAVLAFAMGEILMGLRFV
ncbi:MAG: BatA domain-containing protein [Pseudomonadales bacterium]|jgi:hypothetical protein|nr:BatA domain-containing protein [Kiritimatiellia bacterium]MDP6973183.1 BatA domain-containing protein [Pseudomonadales bacterium]